jgi:spermidine synthase
MPAAGYEKPLKSGVMQRRLYTAAYRRLALVAAWLLAIAATSAAIASLELVEERSSTYNNIYVYKDGPHMIMTFGHNKRFYTESIYDTTNALALPVAYTRYMTVGLAYSGKLDKLLEIGFGGGRTAWYLHKHLPALQVTAVELDPAVVELAIKYFGVRSEDGFKIEISDGRRYMLKNPGTWDVIMVDAYRGPFVPFHLLTEEFFKLVKSRLTPGGVALQNIEPSTMMFDSAIATIQRVFANVDLYEAGGNVVAVAYDGPPRTQAALAARAAALQGRHHFVYPLPDLLQDRRIVNRSVPGKVLSDDFAPVESLLAIEKHNRKLEDISEPPAK